MSRKLPGTPSCPERSHSSVSGNLALTSGEHDLLLLSAIVEASDDAILSNTLDGVITTWNRAAERMYGYTAIEIIGKTTTVLFPPELLYEEEIILERLRQGIATDHFETVRLNKDGTPLDVSVKISPIKDRDGRVIGASTIARDISEHKHKEEQVCLLSTVAAEAINGILITDPQERILYVNPAFERISGYTLAELRGQRPDEMLQGPDTDVETRRQVRAAINAHERVSVEILNYHKNGTPYWIEMHIAPARNEAGQVTHFIAIEIDQTERRRMIETDRSERTKAEAQNNVLEMIAQGQPLAQVLDAVVRLTEGQLPDAVCSVLILDGDTLRHGAAPNLPTAYAKAIDGVTIGPTVGSCGTAAYRKEAVIVTDIAADPLWAEFAGLALAHNLQACWSWPILARDGTVLATFAVYYHNPHHPSEVELACVRQATYLAGVAVERHRREQALRQSEERFALAMAGAKDGLWDWNVCTGQVYFSPRYKAMVGYAEHEFRDHVDVWIAHIHPDDLPHVQERLTAYLERRLDAYEVEFRMRHKDGSYRWILTRGAVLFGEEGKPFRMAGSHTDITEKKQAEHQLQAVNRGLAAANEQLMAANARLEALATTDGLTGLNNHRALQERLREEFDRAVRYNTPLSTLVLDIDKFKQYNDAFGHPAGDVVLRQIAQILRETARSCDVVARYGGEEFVIVLPGVSGGDAKTVAERFRNAIETAAWPERAVTASIGAATLVPTMLNPDALLSNADTALYRSKHRGRNCVTHATDAGEIEALDTEAARWYDSLLQKLLEIQADASGSATEHVRDTLLIAYDATIVSWSRILDLKDKETEGHSERVTAMMVRLMQYLDFNEQEVRFARWGAWLHDIGKIAVPDAILRKPGPLTEEEWVVMRQHTTIAYEMLQSIEFLGPALDIPYCHHEKWDGSGYPCGLKGDEIPLMARLFAVIDVYDALTSDRPYRRAWPEEQVRAHLQEQSGTHFDPRAVNAFLSMLEERCAVGKSAEWDMLSTPAS